MTTPPLNRDHFAVTENYTYLNHAAAGVLPLRTRQALHGFIDAQASGGIARIWPYEAQVPAHRERIARYIGARPGTIALLRNTGDGANVIGAGFPWSQGDEVIVPDDEFPANAQPWLALRRRGVNVRLHDTSRGRLTPDALREMMTRGTKIVTVSWVSFHDGYRHDLAGLAQVAHDAGAFFCVDAMQALGGFPVDVEALGIDALYCGGAKWMLALQGVSFLYVSEALLERLELATPGWRSVADMWDFLNYDQAPAAGATRFEGGTLNFIGALSLSESIVEMEEAGTAAIAAHVLALTDRLTEALQRHGFRVISQRSHSTSSGIVTFQAPGADPVALGAALQERGFVTTYRANGVRVSPHGYNTIDEIDAFVENAVDLRKDPACSPA